MKRRNRSLLIMALTFLMLIISACGKSEFGVVESSDKKLVINAQNASKDAYFMVGSLEVREGEKITAGADLSKGQVRVEIFRQTGEQSIDQMPQTEEDPILKGDLLRTEGFSGTAEAGIYLVKATCLEKASGSIVIEVQPAE